MDEGFPEERPVVNADECVCKAMYTLNQRCARSAVDPPRSIPNRVVKRGSADSTGGVSAGSVGPCTPSSRRGAVAARRAHNPKVGGSNPPAATTTKYQGMKLTTSCPGIFLAYFLLEQHYRHVGGSDQGGITSWAQTKSVSKALPKS